MPERQALVARRSRRGRDPCPNSLPQEPAEVQRGPQAEPRRRWQAAEGSSDIRQAEPGHTSNKVRCGPATRHQSPAPGSPVPHIGALHSPEVSGVFHGRRLGDPKRPMRSPVRDGLPEPVVEVVTPRSAETQEVHTVRAPVSQVVPAPTACHPSACYPAVQVHAFEPSQELQERHAHVPEAARHYGDAQVTQPRPNSAFSTTGAPAGVADTDEGFGSRGTAAGGGGGAGRHGRSRSRRSRSLSGGMNAPLGQRRKSPNYGGPPTPQTNMGATGATHAAVPGKSRPTHAVPAGLQTTASPARPVPAEPDWKRSGPVGAVRQVLVSPYQRMMPRRSSGGARGSGAAASAALSAAPRGQGPVGTYGGLRRAIASPAAATGSRGQPRSRTRRRPQSAVR